MQISSKLLTISLILILLIPQPLVLTVTAQQSQVVCEARENFEYYCSYDLDSGYTEELSIHTVDMEVMNLGIGIHELEFSLSTKEHLRFVQPLSPTLGTPTNETLDGKLLIKLCTEEENFWLRLILNETKQLFDPIDVATLPLGQVRHPLTTKGDLNFDFSINNTEYLDSCLFKFRGPSDSTIREIELQNSDLTYESIGSGFSSSYVMKNVSEGCGQVSFGALVNNLQGHINLEVTATKNKQHTPVQCYINDSSIPLRNFVSAVYELNDFEFALQPNPYYHYGDEATYLLNFTALPRFTLRLDAASRETISSLQFGRMPSNFSVVKIEFIGEPCYEFEFKMDNASNCCMSINLKSKEWYINSMNMTLEEIPNSLKEKYMDPTASKDGYNFNVQDKYVQQWAAELSTNLTNPYDIALKIYENVTDTISFPSNYKELDENGTFRENVSEILKLRIGCCRHFAKVYAALCICSGIPARTIQGTAFNFLDELWKKNHEWTEIYLPGYSWVAVDSSWNQSFLLDERHAKMTYWTYQNGSLSATRINGTTENQLAVDSKDTLSNLIQLCRRFAIGNAQAEVLLDKARFNAEQGNIHEALLCIGEAYVLATDSTLQTANNTQIAGLIVVFVFAIIFVLTIYPVRKKFCALSFEHKRKKTRKIGEIYENALREMYILRLFLSFFLPISIAFIFSSNLDSNLILSLLVMGLGLVTFSSIQLPSLTEPHVFTSVIEDCEGKFFRCIYNEGKSCKARENRLEIAIKEKRIIFFRLQNLSLHTLKNCTIWFTFPENFEISKLIASDNVDFFKEYSIQKRNNAVKFSPTDSYLSVSPDDCLVLPIKVEVIRPDADPKSQEIGIQLASETTWGTSKCSFPIRYV